MYIYYSYLPLFFNFEVNTFGVSNYIFCKITTILPSFAKVELYRYTYISIIMNYCTVYLFAHCKKNYLFKKYRHRHNSISVSKCILFIDNNQNHTKCPFCILLLYTTAYTLYIYI